MHLQEVFFSFYLFLAQFFKFFLSTDHTFNTIFGYYLYIENNINDAENSIAKITSPFTTPNGHTCLVFYYHMFGSIDI